MDLLLIEDLYPVSLQDMNETEPDYSEQEAVGE